MTSDPATAAVPLRRRYEVAPLAADVRALAADPWRAQRSVGQDGVTRESTVDWKILALRSPGGDPDRTDAGGAGLVEHAATPHLAGAGALAALLADFPLPLLGVRLMALGPGAASRVHRDAKCGPPWGLVRLHVPIVTNPGAVVVIDGTEYHWEAGRLWFGDFDRTHQVRNDGEATRIHLVLDCRTGPALRDLVPDWARGLADGMLPGRPDVPLDPLRLNDFRCRFELPARFAEWSEEEPVAAADATLPAEVRVDGDRLVLVVAGRPTFGLVHVGGGEFRLAGWSEERTLRLALDAPTPAVHLVVRHGTTTHETVRPVA
ncbi:aspartyl/asparaginyl beta-hydroxylase domain-containing protein [Actinocatenispora rupis]|uniref:Aspartyl/asparaginy/proline hydroxylase domain-containing protein n=1 Tax=Actinocatenispora rupis TaxID=519421 RepID=A0A8J3J5H3_9ACTN|nr:aspartyl/asparaginyl beta-hydroxylase domain-containing protein [Actinocatenispora rupis]GID12475.1 hypothetical protein Aru02nite_33640 [Actinocatenispora rupis]